MSGRPTKFKNRVEEWLLHHLKRKLEVIHAGEFHKHQAASKAEICKELGISILLEDAPATALECATKGIKVILFNRPWNQNVSHKNIVRAKTWIEAMKAINSFQTLKN